MITPVSFHKDELIFTLPGNEKVMPLPVLQVTFLKGDTGMVSCWKPSWRDRLRLFFGKPIYLVLWFPIQPPVSLTTDNILQEE